MKQKNARRIEKEQEGILSIEALFSLMIFMILMLTMYSIIVMFLANNMIEHALLEANQSLTYETYEMSNMQSSDISIKNFIMNDIYNRFQSPQSYDQNFTSNSGATSVKTPKWYEHQDLATETAKKRFAAYLNGNESDADSMLRAFGIANGINGLNLQTKLSGKDLSLKVDYDIKLLFSMEFGPFHFGTFHFTQSTVSRMWN